MSISRRGRLLKRGVVVVALAIAGVLLSPANPASAHATLLTTTPAAGYSVSTSPATLTLVYDQPVNLAGTPLLLAGPAGKVILGVARLSNGDRWLSAAVLHPLAPGQYTVTWQVTASDGDVVGGSYVFGVGSIQVTQGSSSGSTATHGLLAAAVLRWLLFAALSLALGGWVGQRLARRVIDKSAARGTALASVRTPARTAAVVGTFAALGLCAHLLGSGNIASGLAHFSVPTLLGSRAGQVNVVEVAAFVVAATFAWSRRLEKLAIAPLLVVALAEGERSHVHELGGPWGFALLFIHLTAAAIWVGALSYVLTVAWRWRAKRAAAYRILFEYARVAIMLVLVVAGTGTLAAIVVLPSWSALTSTGYGQLLLVKIGLVVVVLGLAVVGRWRLRTTSPPQSTSDLRPLPGRAAHTERILLGVVLAVTAALASVASPSTASSVVALPPPPTGPVVRLATLTGQTTIDITASNGELLVNTSVPDPNGDGSGTTVNLGAQLGPAGHARTLHLNRCGPDCFVAPVQWAHGANTLTVTAAPKNWTGGSATFTVAWPPVTDTNAFAQVLTAMRAVPSLIVHEAVTSNTAGPAPIVTTSTFSGPNFLAVEPYATLATMPVTVLSRDTDAGSTVLGFALVDQGYFFQLTVDTDHRITGEVITAPEHLLTRTFDYPAR